MGDNKTLSEKYHDWTERMKKRAEEEDARKKQEAERLQQDYLRRTGRTEMKP